MDIRDHGIWVDKKQNRVICNYCKKEMQGFYRLKRHLAGIGPDVTACDDVTLNVRQAFRSLVILGTVGNWSGRDEVVFPEDVEADGGQDSSTNTVFPEDVETIGSQDSSRNTVFVEDMQTIGSQNSSSNTVFPENWNTGVEEAAEQELLSKKAQKSIARFFYENGLDFSAVESPSFKEMLLAKIVGAGQMHHKLPTIHDLKGWMLQEALKEMQDHVKKVKESWAITGCSILLDAWVDEKGRDLVSFLADCPAGPVYLKSVDVSDIKEDITALASLLDKVVEEIGGQQVIQVIACSTSGWVGEVGKFFAANSRKFFWSVSVSQCFNLMLDRIGTLDSYKEILDNTRCISEFINHNPSVLRLLRDHNHGIGLTVSSSAFEFLTPYLTLESVWNAKNGLLAMFTTTSWTTEQGRRVSNLVSDTSFWESVERLVKSTSPLIQGLDMFSGANNQHMGYIYDIMDGIKENIAKEFNHEESCYKLIWEVVDEVWNTPLHSPLHVTGYFLNPSAFYSTDFCNDPEVTTGLISTLFRLVKDCDTGAKVSEQLVMYTQGKGSFDEASQADQYTDIPPAEWWAKKLSEHPELQSLAIKILSQTCEGASRYKLKRSLAEKLLLTEGMSHGEQKHLEELAFVHYNLHLQTAKPN